MKEPGFLVRPVTVNFTPASPSAVVGQLAEDFNFVQARGTLKVDKSHSNDTSNNTSAF